MDVFWGLDDLFYHGSRYFHLSCITASRDDPCSNGLIEALSCGLPAIFLNASVGFGGSCFKKDILNLVYIAESYGLKEVAEYWKMVVKINEYQQERFVANIIRALFNTVVDKKIAIFGFSFKVNTGDTRESPARFVVNKLIEEKAILSITDPHALENARAGLAEVDGEILFELDPYRAAKGASAVVLVTEWDVFRNLDYERI